MMKKYPILFATIFLMFTLISCSTDSDDPFNDDQIATDDEIVNDDAIVTELHAAFAEFDTDATDIFLSDGGTTVTIETTGLPNHETVYWGEGHALFREEPDVALTPSIISSNNNADVITVDATPNLDGSTVATELNAIGIAVSGAAIFNDQEGNGTLDQAAASLDWTGAHIGPGVYHYHLEPRAFSNDDDNLVGVLLDGVFLYGRRDYPSNEYPTDLDESGGHFGPTPHNPDGEYHYHIINEEFSTTGSFIAFAGPYQGF